ncbi:MAG: acetyltransferase [Acidobacteria bacterium]|nr:acetyltransferase [Acidobacteriota bacterium]MDA1235095.1 acetyltransferase [Acidobacteriota bacterium]
MNRTQLLILGAGRFAEDVADWAAEIPGVALIGFYQDVRPNGPATIDGLPIFNEAHLRENITSCKFVCAVGSSGRVAFIEKVAAWGAAFATLVHPSARVSKKASLGPGTLVGPLSNIAAHARIGSQVILNRGASIAHHVVIEDYATIGPGAIIAGSASIGRRALIGAGAVVKPGIHVGADATVGIGTVAVHDVKSGSTVFGVPARLLPSG